jgi:hypothetical protein
MTLEQLLNSVDQGSDYYEEICEDYLREKSISLTSHSRRNIYLLAWVHGWRPKN